uniref:Uncharacterized protein n=1 Tax=viral metagenome TaxID=1070528 RepID=A0A6H1Z7X9_9ZZZZ
MLREQQAIPGIPSAVDEQIAVWEMDKEGSHAFFHIIPVVEGENRYLTYNIDLEVRPYPNPFGFGGMYGGGGCYDKAGIREKVKEFRGYIQRWRDKGMYKVEFKRLPEQVRRPITHINTGAERKKAVDKQPALL